MAPPAGDVVVHHLWRLSLLLWLAVAAAARMVPVEYLYPPFNLTYLNFIDTNGVFLVSPGGNFSAAVYNAGAGASASEGSQSRFFFSVLHSASRTPVWSATAAGSTILESVVLSLSAAGLALLDPSGAQPDPAWATPRLREPAAALRLVDTGELALIGGGRGNATLWSSFERPTDTLLGGGGQQLRLGTPLTSSASGSDLSPGAYRLVVTPGDALLQWQWGTSSATATYWALSSDPGAVQDSSRAVASMAVNASGIYLLADNGRDTVYRLLFPEQDPRAAAGESPVILLKVDPSGRLRALALTGGAAVLTSVWAAPGGDCELPLACPSLSLCTAGGNGSTCMCPDALSTAYSSGAGGCAPADGAALAVPSDDRDSSSSSCGGRHRYVYVSLGGGVGYLPTRFAQADSSGGDLPACRDLCSANCSCLGFVYRNSSRSCILLRHQIGSLSRAGAGQVFVKATPASSAAARPLSLITIVFGIVLPAVAAVLISLLLYALVCRPQQRQLEKRSGGSWLFMKLPAMLSSSLSRGDNSEADDAAANNSEVLIPGLPTRFTYAELEAATDGFRWQIGCGGFGSVFRGELPDRSAVAVKRMNSQHGRREFLTEIAVIGSVHHVNLVKLRGFCAEGATKLLVYEYMNRGSLDRTLFVGGFGRKDMEPALDWPARLRVCVGAARGLAYLHGGCDRKILHCDVKPENILLDDRGAVKIADFGLAKLLSPEQSGLFTTMRGTRGYLAPEWLMNAPITDKADVYSFGMVLLEILRGRKNSNLSSSRSREQQQQQEPLSYYFPALALELHEQGRYADLLDPRLEGRADVAQLERVVRVALCCLHEDAALRPTMAAVAAMLDGTMDAAEPRPDLLRYLRMYGRGLVDLRRPAAAAWMDKGSDTTAGVSSSWSPPSCVSAQQLSGPR
ncbi:unnamed protein product [Urochloa humidicola]